MKRAGKAGLLAFLLFPSLTGCWDLREPNQLSFITGAALDVTEDGIFQVSSQFAIPSAIGGGQENGGSGKKSFRVLTATGENIMDAGQHLQTEISRQLFYGHRQTILIGHRLAERGIADVLDMFLRNPQSELRSVIYVVKDGQAKDILNVKPIFDPYSAPALVGEQATLRLKPYYYRNFLDDALSEGIQPLMPTVQLTPSKNFVYSGAAILNKENGFKLVGFLNTEESFYANWLTGRISGFIVTCNVPQGKGIVSLNLQTLERKIRLKKGDGGMKLEIRITGKGLVVENNASMDPSKREDQRFIQQALGNHVSKSFRRLIGKAQNQYKIDIFGIGEVVHHQHPVQWKTLKRDWNETFSSLPVDLKVEIQIKDPGQTTSSLLLSRD